MIPTTIFLDLDDVLNRFTPYALEYVGCPEGSNSSSWDIIAAANALHPTRKFTLRSFWDEFVHCAWASVPVSEEFELLLLHSVALVGKENICILTAPVDSPGCLTGKEEWIHKYCPEWLHRQFMIGYQKRFCAYRPDALLIDDADHNVEAFRAAGGQAILVPRPWNSLRGTSAKAHLINSFNVFFREKNRRERC